MKTATILSATLWPKMYHMERILRADTVIVRSDGLVNDDCRPYRCAVRPTFGKRSYVSMRLKRGYMPADLCRVAPQIHWRKKMAEDLRRAYMGLLHADLAQSIAHQGFDAVPQSSDWLVDYLMASLAAVLKELGWGEKEIIRGSTHQMVRYRNESEYVLNLCLEANADMLIIGASDWRRLNWKMFTENGVAARVQEYRGTPQLSSLDSILDVVARHGTSNIEGLF